VLALAEAIGEVRIPGERARRARARLTREVAEGKAWTD
jgi:hypothetical protein